MPGPIVDDDTGFRPIFNGKSLTGWDGDLTLWHVENGSIVGEVTDSSPLKTETFLVWRGGEPGDFELKAEYRISDLGNSGLEYRSTDVPNSKWDLDGYQMDIDGRPWGERFSERVLKKNGVDCPRITGENVGQVIFALPGQISILSAHDSRRVIGNFASCAAVSKALNDGWNTAQLIIRGKVLVHMINGQIMSVVIDDNSGRASRGKLALQLHPGGAMRVEFRNLRLKVLD